MKNVWIIGILICFCSCKMSHETKELTPSYVQTGEVQLINPKIEVNNVIIDTSVTVAASLQVDGVTMYYTNDGSEPNQTSEKYIGPITVIKPETYIFKAFHPDYKSSETALVSFYKKGTDIHDISLITPLNEQYKGQGKSTLINHKKGTSDFRDGQWIGVTEPLIAIIDFKDTIFLDSIDLGYLVNTSAWIFPVDTVSIAFSKDGINFTAMDTVNTVTKLKKELTKRDNIHIPVGKNLRKIKITVSNIPSIPEWHQGSGTPAWLFMDEWIFNSRNTKDL